MIEDNLYNRILDSFDSIHDYYEFGLGGIKYYKNSNDDFRYLYHTMLAEMGVSVGEFQDDLSRRVEEYFKKKEKSLNQPLDNS